MCAVFVLALLVPGKGGIVGQIAALGQAVGLIDDQHIELLLGVYDIVFSRLFWLCNQDWCLSAWPGC